MAESFEHELTAGDRYTIRQAEDSLPDSPWSLDIVERYSFYRRRGHDKAASIAYAIVWAKNCVEQADRRRPLDRRYPVAVEW